MHFSTSAKMTGPIHVNLTPENCVPILGELIIKFSPFGHTMYMTRAEGERLHYELSAALAELHEQAQGQAEEAEDVA